MAGALASGKSLFNTRGRETLVVQTYGADNGYGRRAPNTYKRAEAGRVLRGRAATRNHAQTQVAPRGIA